MPFSLNFLSFLLTNLSFLFAQNKVQNSSFFVVSSSRGSRAFIERLDHRKCCTAFVLLAGWRFVKIFKIMMCLPQSWKSQCPHLPTHKWFSSAGPVCGSDLRLTLKQSVFSSLLRSLFWFLLKMLLLFI